MVHPMVSRGIAAAFIVIFSVALMLVPNETFGRSGGGISGRSSSRSSASHSSTMNRPSSHANARSLHNRHKHKGDFRGLPIVSGIYSPGTYYAPWDAAHRYPPNDIDLNSPPSNAQPESDVTSPIPDRYQVYEYRRGCPSETVTVPWEDDKEHSINIVRC